MHRATQSIVTVLICTAPGAPALAHTNPRVRWQLRTAPPRTTLLFALGPSGTRRLTPCASRSGARPSEVSDLRPTVSGWTQPLGLRLVLRW